MIAVMAEFGAIISNPFMTVAVIVTVLKARQKVDTWLYREANIQLAFPYDST
jgi:hypothetical protein